MATVTRGRVGAAAAADQETTGLRFLGVCLGVFLVFQGIGKLAWFTDSGPLSGALQSWLRDAGPTSRWYLETVAIPGVPLFARLVPLGELLGGSALLMGFWTRLAAAALFVMILNFHVASGAIFQYGFLTNAFGLPVLGGLLALTIGGGRLPW
ncbi:MAG: DoxX family membrane protein, partial [Vicinamibacterales bacterium]